VTAPSSEPERISSGVAPTEIPRRSRAGWIAVIVAGVIALGAGGAYGIYSLLTSRSQRGPRTGVETPKQGLDLRLLRFDTVVVGPTGAVEQRRKDQVQYFVEDLGGVTIDMVRVPGGSFAMGTADRRAASEVSTPIERIAYAAPQRPRPYQRPGPPPAPRPRPEPYGEQPPSSTKPEKPEGKKGEEPGKRGKEPAPIPPEPDADMASERPQHSVTVPLFYMSRCEITQAEWRAVAALPKVDRDLNPDPSEIKGDLLPVENVSWQDASEFCARLSLKTGRTYKLPTEAEWEFACRGGTETLFAFGPTITPDLANYDGNYTFGDGPRGVSRRKTIPVGVLEVANPIGLCDMHGNVWEWCLDVWHPTYDGAPTDGSAWMAGGDANFHVIRGGSWMTGPADCRSARRVNNATGNRNSDVGFRIVMTPER
jgi:formylglycine-generating enzyme required for sulfatase activity